jgi:hypothetical protein
MHHNPTHTHTRALDPRCNSLGCLNDRVVLLFPLSMQVCRYASHFEPAIHRLYLSTASIAVPTRVSLCLSFDVSGYLEDSAERLCSLPLGWLAAVTNVLERAPLIVLGHEQEIFIQMQPGDQIFSNDGRRSVDFLGRQAMPDLPLSTRKKKSTPSVVTIRLQNIPPTFTGKVRLVLADGATN